MGRLVLLGIVLVGLIAGALQPVPSSLARFTDAAPGSSTFVAGTLAPPSGLSAAGGSLVTLSWSVSPSPFATGYAIYRSATSGGGYSQVGTKTPRSATAATDSPGVGTWYYIIRATYAGWTSTATGEAVAVVTPTSTPFAQCVSNAADTTGAGDNNGYQSNPARACANANQYAQDTNTGTSTSASCGTGAVPDPTKDRHRFWGFATGLPGSVAHIDGITVQADIGMDSANGTNTVCVQLSWDGGSTWTTMQPAAIPAAARTTYLYGGTADTWGRTWALAELSAANLRVRLIDASTVSGRDFRLYYIAVSVTYAP